MWLVMKTNECIDAQHQVVSNWNFIQFITRKFATVYCSYGANANIQLSHLDSLFFANYNLYNGYYILLSFPIHLSASITLCVFSYQQS